MKGLKTSHGTPRIRWASRVDIAPQQLASTSTTSGLTLRIAASMSATSIRGPTGQHLDCLADHPQGATCGPVVALQGFDAGIDTLGRKTQPTAQVHPGVEGADVDPVPTRQPAR